MGRNTGIAAVVFKTPELAKEAQEKFNNKTIENSCMEIFND